MTTIDFEDINEQLDALARYGATLDDIRRRLHATDETAASSSARTSRSRCG